MDKSIFRKEWILWDI